MQDFKLKAFYDADWASCIITRQSLTSYYSFLRSSLLSQKTHKKNTISWFSVEVEYRNMASTVFELQWINNVLHEFNINPPLHVFLHYDNKATQHIITNPIFHERTKHINVGFCENNLMEASFSRFIFLLTFKLQIYSLNPQEHLILNHYYTIWDFQTCPRLHLEEGGVEYIKMLYFIYC